MFASFICLYYLAHVLTGSNRQKHLKPIIKTACWKHISLRSMTVTLVTRRLGTSVVINKYFPEKITPPVIVFRRNFHSHSFYLIVNSDSLQVISLHLNKGEWCLSSKYLLQHDQNTKLQFEYLKRNTVLSFIWRLYYEKRGG